MLRICYAWKILHYCLHSLPLTFFKVSSMAEARCESVSCSKLTTNDKEDDGTVFKEANGVRHHFLPGDLVQRCGSIETLLAVGGMLGTLNTIQAIWLESKQPITPEEVLDALWILSRQVPHLQLCLSRKGWRLWFKRMKKLTVDFETSTDDVMHVYQQLLETKYDMWSGPLWKAKLVYFHPNDKSEKRAGHSAALIFSVHHCITDGTTNMQLCREAVSILNQIRNGVKCAPKLAPLAVLIDEVTKGASSKAYLIKSFCQRFNSTIIRSYYFSSFIGQTLPISSKHHAKTKVLFDDFTETETKHLLKMCKDAKITVLSFIVTITNFALLTVVQSKSETPIGKTTVKVRHCVNMRRYFEPKYGDTSGCHISFLEDKAELSLDDVKDFWNQAKKTHYSMKEHLEVSKDHVMVVPLLRCGIITLLSNVFMTKHEYKNRTDCHYLTTNMGNLKDLLPSPKAGDSIEITHILRSVTSLLMGNPFIITIHTFRERFMISMDYSTHIMKDDVANDIFNIICKFIRNTTDFDVFQGI